MATIKLRDYLESLSSKEGSALNDKITILDSADGSKIKTVLKSDLVNLTFLAAELRDDFLEQYGEGTISGSIQVDHDGTTNFVANEHIDHTSITITAGNGLAGGGDISDNRTIDVVSANNGIITNTDNIELDTTSTTFTTGVKSKLNTETVVSSSAQITITNTTGFTTLSSSLQSTDNAIAARVTAVESFSSSLDSTYASDSELTAVSSALDSTDNAIAARVTAVESFSSSLDSTYASDSELTAVSSAFDSTINSLNTADVSEDSSNKYYTDVRVKTKLTAEDVVSGSSSDVKTFLAISASDISDVDAFSQSGTYASLRAQATTAADVDLGNVTNESKATMFTSPVFTTNPTAPTQTGTDDSTKLATTQFVQARITDIIGNAGSTLDTLGELSASLSEDSGALSTLTTTVGTKLAKASNLSDLQDAATARGNLGVDAAGADNSTDVTLAGSYDYLTIDGQEITLGQVDASADISNLTTSNVTEGTNLYYTDAKVKTKLNTETVVSSSAQITNGSSLVSSSIQVFSGGDISGSVDNLTVQKVQGVALTSDEATQISNIGSETISSTQWGYLGASDQGITTTSDVTFNIISGSRINIVDTTNPGSEIGSVVIEGRRDGSPNVLTLRARDNGTPAGALPQDQGAVLRWQGFDGTNFENMGYILTAADRQAMADGDSPSYMSFGVNADASETPAEVMRLDSYGVFTLPNSSNDAFLNNNGTAYEIDINRHPESGVFSDTAKSHARISMNGAVGGSEISFKTANAINTVASTKMTISGSGEVQIGAASVNSNGLTIEKTGNHIFLRASSATAGEYWNFDVTSNNELGILQDNGDGISIKDTGVLQTPNGIVLNSQTTGGTPNATNVTLNDYEEGTFVPEFWDESSNEATVSSPIGFYTKIGRLVTLQLTLGNTNTTGLTAANTLLIKGLPFTIGGSTQLSTAAVNFYNVAFGEQAIAWINAAAGTDYIRILKQVTGGAGVTMKVQDVTSGTNEISFTITYHTA